MAEFLLGLGSGENIKDIPITGGNIENYFNIERNDETAFIWEQESGFDVSSGVTKEQIFKKICLTLTMPMIVKFTYCFNHSSSTSENSFSMSIDRGYTLYENTTTASSTEVYDGGEYFLQKGDQISFQVQMAPTVYFLNCYFNLQVTPRNIVPINRIYQGDANGKAREIDSIKFGNDEGKPQLSFIAHSAGLAFEHIGRPEYDLVWITGIGLCSDKKVIIPTEIENAPVDRITKLEGPCTELVIRDNITSIYDNAIKDCTSLDRLSLYQIPTNTNLIIPNSVTQISIQKSQTLYTKYLKLDHNGGSKLEKIYLNTDKIGAISDENEDPGIFKQCSSLKYIVNHSEEGCSEIGEEAFRGCTSLTNVGKLHHYGADIGNYAFDDCSALNQEMTVRNVGKYAFDNCQNLPKVTIYRKGNIEIGTYAFRDCLKLKQVEMKGIARYIRQYAFQNCELLESINLSYVSEEIEARAFQNCRSLKEVTLNAKVIGTDAFYGCTSLETVFVSKTVEEICDGAFGNCNNLKNIVYEGTKEEWEKITKKAIILFWNEPTITYNTTKKEWEENN